jgi:hypothetical protein
MINVKQTKNEIMISKLIEYLNEYAGIDLSDKCRKRHYVFSRAVYFRIAAEYIPDTLHNVASAVNRDHATAIHARTMFKEIEDYKIYNEKIESQKAFLAEQIAKLNDVIRSQKQKIDAQNRLLDKAGLEDHEVRYRDLPSEKKYIFKERVNAILKMI